MMTIKRKIVIGLDDVKAVTFVCLNENCKVSVKISASPDAAWIPPQCPSCKAVWGDHGISQQSETSHEKNFVEALQKLRAKHAATQPTFRILLEFEDAPGAIEELITTPLTKAA